MDVSLVTPHTPRCQFVEMRGWRLERPDQGEVPSVLNTASNTVVADVQELPPTVQTLHWVAPQSYLGDRVSHWRERAPRQQDLLLLTVY